MAERRMFAKTIIDSDAFLDMSVTARLLYYDLAMRADDDGFVNSPKKIMRMVGASEDDRRMLAARKFIIPLKTEWLLSSTGGYTTTSEKTDTTRPHIQSKKSFLSWTRTDLTGLWMTNGLPTVYQWLTNG